jgi:hypothetical protein
MSDVLSSKIIGIIETGGTPNISLKPSLAKTALSLRSACLCYGQLNSVVMRTLRKAVVQNIEIGNGFICLNRYGCRLNYRIAFNQYCQREEAKY